MENEIRVLGIDPGFASIGLAVVRLTDIGEQPELLKVFSTEKSAKKLNVMASADNVRRARELSDVITSLIERYNIKLICAESMSFPRSSSIAAKMAMCWGAMSAISQIKNIPILQATPMQIKKKICGVKSASKADIEESIRIKYGDIIETLIENEHICKTEREHPIDALAAIVACSESETFMMMHQMRRAA